MTTYPECSQCRNQASVLLYARDYNRHISDEVFTYYRCAACGFIFLYPIPSNLNLYYPESYYQFPATLEEYAPQVGYQQYKVDLVRQFKSSGRLLEIGPGPGDFAYLAKKAGFNVDVIEMDERCCRFLRDVIGVTTVNSDDTVSAIQTMGQYDVIALWQVIEHLPNPWTVLDALISHLSSDGVLVIAAPNPQALQFRLFGYWWTHLDAPRHLNFIPIPLLSQRLKNSDCTPLLITTTDTGSLGWNKFGWQHSLDNLIRHRFSMSLPGAVFNRLFAPLERKGWHGSTYTAIFQRSLK
jgi:hypothetical protein